MNYLLMHKSRNQRKWSVGFQKDSVNILISPLYFQYPFKLINFLISFNIRYDVSRALNTTFLKECLYNLLFPIYEHLLYLCVRDIISFIEGIFQIFPMRMIQRIYQPWNWCVILWCILRRYRSNSIHGLIAKVIVK